MRFGGHQTFAVREGWLHKGLKLLIHEPNKLIDEFVADWLGVGSNMAKSINHWLVATGLAELSPGKNARKTALAPTPFGQLVFEKDPFFSEIGTWWTLHINLVHSEQHAYSWAWFFNRFSQVRFERSICVDNLKRNLQLSGQRMPSIKTIERDLACLLASYARKIPSDQGDPEDTNESPFIDLNLLSFYRDTGTFQINQNEKNISPQIFGYSLAKAFQDKQPQVSIKDASSLIGGPGKVFCLTPETLFEQINNFEKRHGDTSFEIFGQEGERFIRYERKLPNEWLEEYYDVQGSEDIGDEFMNAYRQVLGAL